jgi:uncharacterized membrane protein (GlpM family)
MTVSEVLWRFLAGGSLVTLVSLAGRTRNPYLAGLVVLFPVVTIVGLFFLSTRLTPHQLSQAALFSLLSVPTVIAFLAVVFLTVGRLRIWQSLLLGIGAWLVIAGVSVAVNELWLHMGVARR